VSGADTPNVIGPSGIAGHFFAELDVVVAPPPLAAVVVAPPLAAVVVAPPEAAVVVAPADVVAALLPPLLSRDALDVASNFPLPPLGAHAPPHVQGDQRNTSTNRLVCCPLRGTQITEGA
jgi:hypothetical protein